MAKLSITQKPTFEASVKIPVPGAKPVPVKFTFKARGKDDFKAFMERLATEDREDVDVVLDVVSGWELEDAYGRESVETLLQNYLGAGRAIIEPYITEQPGASRGN